MFILRDIKAHKCTNPEVQRSPIPFPIRLTKTLKKHHSILAKSFYKFLTCKKSAVQVRLCLPETHFIKASFVLFMIEFSQLKQKLTINKGISYENFSKPTHFLLIFDAVYASQLRSRRDRRTYRYSQ